MTPGETRRQELAREYERVPSAQAFIAVCDRLIAAERAYYKTAADIDETLGRALGYPRYCDDQLNFPGTTDNDGVCTGDHVPESLAAEAANLIAALKRERDEALESRNRMWESGRHFPIGSNSALLGTISSVSSVPEATSEPPAGHCGFFQSPYNPFMCEACHLTKEQHACWKGRRD